MSTSLQMHGGGELASTVPEIREQVQLIQKLLKEVMKEDVHFGTIPGTQKATLLKPGAEKIGLVFRLAPSFIVERDDLPGGHREYTVTTRLVTRDGTPVGEGVGVCSTMESKYRYRWENTEIPVPKEYWETRDPEILGGRDLAPRKAWTGERNNRKQVWMIFQKVEHSDPADYYNTVIKMAKKRSHVDAILTATGASDIFDQDLDDPDAIPPEDTPQGGSATTASEGGNGKKAKQSQPQAQADDSPVTESQQRIIRARLKDSGIEEKALLEHFKVKSIEAIKKSQLNDVLAHLQGHGQ